MRRTNASLIVPTIAPEVANGRAGRDSSKKHQREGAESAPLFMSGCPADADADAIVHRQSSHKFVLRVHLKYTSPIRWFELSFWHPTVSIGFRFGASCLAVRTPFAEMVKFAR